MRILYITPRINNQGGVAKVLSIKTDYLIRKWGHEIHILTQNKGNEDLFFSFHPEIRLHDNILKGRGLAYFRSYQQQLQQTVDIVQPDLVVVTDNGYKAFLIPYTLKTKARLIFESHGSLYNTEKPMGRIGTQGVTRFKKIAVKRYDLVVFLSKANQEEWGIFTNAKVIPNPIVLQDKKSPITRTQTVIAVSRNSYEKGIDRLLAIWQKVAQANPDWKLVIYGNPEGYYDLNQLATELGILNSVSFLAPVRDIESEYDRAAVYAMTSRFEGFPMVLLEAMRSGLPTVAYDCPCGPAAIIENEHTGFLIADGAILDYASALDTLLKDAELRTKLGANAQQAVKKYEASVIMEQWNTVLHSLISTTI